MLLLRCCFLQIILPAVLDIENENEEEGKEKGLPMFSSFLLMVTSFLFARISTQAENLLMGLAIRSYNYQTCSLVNSFKDVFFCREKAIW